MIKFDAIANNNKLISVHPLEKFVFSIICLLTVMTSISMEVNLLVFGLISLIIVGVAQIGTKTYFKTLTLPLSFLLLSSLTIIFSIEFNNSHLTVSIPQENIALAINLFVKSMAAVSSMYFLILTTPLHEILAVMKTLKVPQIMLDLMALTYHFIFILLNVGRNISVSQNCRLGYNSWRNSLNSLGILVAQLFIRTYYKYEMLNHSMVSRGYTGELDVLDDERPISYKHLVWLSMFGCLLISINFIGVVTI